MLLANPIEPPQLWDRTKLLIAAEQGRLDRLPCPVCGRDTVQVWFTQPAADQYRTWFVCGGCEFEMRAQNVGRPPCFSESRIDAELQRRDAAPRRTDAS